MFWSFLSLKATNSANSFFRTNSPADIAPSASAGGLILRSALAISTTKPLLFSLVNEGERLWSKGFTPRVTRQLKINGRGWWSIKRKLSSAVASISTQLWPYSLRYVSLPHQTLQPIYKRRARSLSSSAHSYSYGSRFPMLSYRYL